MVNYNKIITYPFIFVRFHYLATLRHVVQNHHTEITPVYVDICLPTIPVINKQSQRNKKSLQELNFFIFIAFYNEDQT